MSGRAAMSRAWLGTLLLVASAAAYSTAGFFTRLIQVDAWTLLFWRGLFGGSFLAGVVRGAGARPAVAVDPRHGLGGRAGRGLLGGRDGVLPERHAAHRRRRRMVIDAAIPFITAALAWADPGRARERVDAAAPRPLPSPAWRSWRDRRSRTASSRAMLLAFAMAVLMALVIVLIRRKRGVNMVPAVCGSAFLCALIVWPFASAACRSTRDELRPAGAVRRQPVRHGPAAARLRHAAGLGDARRADRRAADAARHAVGLARLRRAAGDR